MAANLFEKPVFLVQGNDITIATNTIVDFINSATASLHIAIYDFQLEGDTEQKVVDAINAQAAKGVEVMIAYDHTKANQGKADKGNVGDDPAPRGTQGFVLKNFPDGGSVKTMPIAGSHLMHDKYIINDGRSVLMGSTNFTTGAWTLQENNILTINSEELAAKYEQDFNDLWTSGNILRTGVNDFGTITSGSDEIEYAFCPGEGSAAASLFVDAIQGAGKQIYLATMVLSSGSILGALSDYLDGGGTITGIYDATQMKNVERDWSKGSGSDKLATWQKIQPNLVGKHSTPFAENAPHDFMHNKVMVTDSRMITGSFNLSNNAEMNAENAISVNNPDLITAYKNYIDQLIAKYGK